MHKKAGITDSNLSSFIACPSPISVVSEESLTNLGSVDRDQNRPDEARKELGKALQIRRELAQKNPETYLPGVAEALYNLAQLSVPEISANVS